MDPWIKQNRPSRLKYLLRTVWEKSQPPDDAHRSKNGYRPARRDSSVQPLTSCSIRAGKWKELKRKFKRTVHLCGLGPRTEYYDDEFTGQCGVCNSKAIKVVGSSLSKSTGIRFRLPNESRGEVIVYCLLCSHLLSNEFVSDKNRFKDTRARKFNIGRFFPFKPATGIASLFVSLFLSGAIWVYWI